jgi:hypothetical protein
LQVAQAVDPLSSGASAAARYLRRLGGGHIFDAVQTLLLLKALDSPNTGS